MEILEDSYVETIDFKLIPAKALNVSSRMKLSWFLNPEQPLRSASGIARDYRGLAEQMDFEYNDIKNFQRSDDPTLKILEAWEGRPNSTLDCLINFLTNMDRYDVIEDTKVQFENDAKSHMRRNGKLKETPIQVPEVTSCHPTEIHPDNPNILTVSDAQTGSHTFYDAYVCYAEEDTEFVSKLAEYLESPQFDLKLFIKGRDLLLGASEPKAYFELIQERCRRMLIILSPNFLGSPECEFQSVFAAGLAIEQQQRKLIPVIIAPCEMPIILKFISKIDFTKPAIPTWLWNKLIMSIRGNETAMFVPPFMGSAQSRQVPSVSYAGSPAILYPSTSSHVSCNTNPIITFPPTSCYTASPNSSASADMMFTNSSINSSAVVPSVLSPNLSVPATTTVVKNTPPTKHRWYHNIKERLTSSSASSSSSSSATSGFHSQSSVMFESKDVSAMQNSNETPM